MPQQPGAGPIGLPIIELQAIDSTNNYARNLIYEGLAQHGTAVFAHHQLAGKGQRGRTWLTEPSSSLILTILLNPYPLLVSQQFRLSACIAVAAFDLLSSYAGNGLSIKWPNDIYWQDRKAGGILIESIIRTEPSNELADRKDESPAANWPWAIVGIGININQMHFPPDLPDAVSLKQITGTTYDPLQLAKQLCKTIDTRFEQLKNEAFEFLHARYNEHLYKRGENTRLKKDNRVFEAIIKSVSAGGKLVVQHGVEEEFDFGTIEWVK